MRKIAILLILIGFANILSAQNKVNTICKDIQAKLECYDSDSIIVQAIKMLDLFEKGEVVDHDVVACKYIGLVYVLSEDADCISSSCNNPAILPAVWFGNDMGICMMGIRGRSDNDYKRPLSNYVQSYLKRMSVSDEPVTRYMAINNFDNSSSPYYEEDNSIVIEDRTKSYTRKNGDYIIGLSLSEDNSNAMIYVFDIVGQERLLGFDTASQKNEQQSVNYSEETRQKIEELKAEEKSRNEFSEMIEAIVNNPELSSYYHNRDMFILSLGLFRDDLEVKYRDNDMFIVSMPLDGITDYIEFTRHTYDGETNHRVLFNFQIQKEGVQGSAIFKYENDKWILDSMQVFEN